MHNAPDRAPREQVSATPANDAGAEVIGARSGSQAKGSDKPNASPANVTVSSGGSPATLTDPAFATLQALFPGRVLSIQADEDEAAPDETAANEPAEIATDANGQSEPGNGNDD